MTGKNEVCVKVGCHYFKQDWSTFLSTGEETQGKVPQYLRQTKILRDRSIKILESKIKSKEILCPNYVTSIEELFSKAGEIVNSTWLDTASKLISKDIHKGKNKIYEKEDSERLLEVINDKSKLRKALEKDNYFKFEMLSIFLPDVWKEILLFASVKEQQKLEIVSTWVDSLSNDNGIFKIINISKIELQLMLDMQKTIQPLIDQAFIKQIEYGGNGNPIELNQIAGHLITFADQITTSSTLPNTYQKLPKHLKSISQAFTSKATPEELPKIWAEIEKNNVVLAQSGCPIMINCHNKVIGEKGERDDLEFSIQLRTQEALELEKNATPYYKKATLLSKNKLVPPVIVGFNISNSGVNLYYQTIGEARKNVTSIYSDRLERDINGEVIFSNYITTLLHELGHQIKVDNTESVFDEFKADLLGILIYKQLYDEKLHPIELHEYIYELLYGYVDEIVTSSGTQGISSDNYSLLGKFFLSFFIEKEIVHIVKDKIVINKYNYQLQFLDLAKIGNDLLCLCEGKNFNAEVATKFLKARKNKINNKALEQYIKYY